MAFGQIYGNLRKFSEYRKKTSLSVCSYNRENKYMVACKNGISLFVIIIKYYRLSHNVVTSDVYRDVSAAYC